MKVVSVPDLVFALASGATAAPADDTADPKLRWMWIADLYGHPNWGLGSTVPSFSRLCADDIATVCRDTASGIATVDDWRRIDQVAHRGLDSTDDLAAASYAWLAVIDTATDAFDHLAGVAFAGVEAIADAWMAVCTAHSSERASQIVEAALLAWVNASGVPLCYRPTLTIWRTA